MRPLVLKIIVRGLRPFCKSARRNGRTSEVSFSGTTVYRKHLKCGIAGVVQQVAGCLS